MYSCDKYSTLQNLVVRPTNNLFNIFLKYPFVGMLIKIKNNKYKLLYYTLLDIILSELYTFINHSTLIIHENDFKQKIGLFKYF